MKKVAVFLAPGFEECEALMTVDLLRRAQLDTTMYSIHNTDEVTGSHNITVKADKKLNELNELFDCVILPGGMPGTKYLMESKEVNALVVEHFKQNRLVAAICAAPSVLGELQLLQGKKATCFPGFEDQLHGAEVLNQKAVVDGNIITAKGLGAAVEFAHAIISYLINSKTADQVVKTIQY
ncbi:MAG: DJ-1/PfpI family protein [Erysipelotrichaceae bacterium]|nr:DJ-1/PfpI family protein [Erysipelotrichaceae bacterium]